ncbi:MAG: hypothetical protein MUE63_02220 [Xanthomonadales bacterium]|nr:hypothetical protein [Xanthomonadales bacterium]
MFMALLVELTTGDVRAAETYIGIPAVGEHRVDICYEWGMQCAGEAAQAWCKAQGYDRAIEWEIDHDIGAMHPTLVLGTGQVCDQAHCDGYSSVVCALEDAWTKGSGNGGIVVSVERESKQSPEGILVVAVSEQDVHLASAAVVGVTGLALVHAPPGKWRLYAVNYGNPQQIRPSLGDTVEVPAGKEGMYILLQVD